VLFSPYMDFDLTLQAAAFVPSPKIDQLDSRKAAHQHRRNLVLLTLQRGESPHWIDYRVTIGDAAEVVRVFFRREVVPYTYDCAYGRAVARVRARKTLGVSANFPVKRVEAIAWSETIDDLMH
jgi:hypothetical protein